MPLAPKPRAAARGATARGDDGAVGLEEHRLALPGADGRRHPAVVAERRIETRGRRGCRAVNGDVGHVGARHRARAVAHRADLVGVARLRLHPDVIGQSVGAAAGEGERAFIDLELGPDVVEHQPGPLEPVDRAADREAGGLLARRVAVEDRHLGAALVAEHGAVGIGERDRERLRRLAFVVLEDRELDEPRGGVPVGEGDRRARLGVVGASLRRAGARGDGGARLAGRPAGARDAGEHGHARGLVGGVSGLDQLQRASRRIGTRGALRGGERLDGGLREGRRTVCLEVRGLHERGDDLLRIGDERFERRLPAARVECLGVEAHVHGEQLAITQRRQRDVHRHRMRQLRDRM